MIKIKLKYKLNLYDTITCGQIFRFDIEDDNSYTVILKDRVVNLKLDDNILIVKSNNEENIKEIIEEYLDLNRNYDDINKKLLEKDSKLKATIDSCNGLKIIKQDPLNTVLEYIISQNNSVNTIRKVLDNIAFNYGEKVEFRDKKYYLLPDINKLSKLSIEDFRKCKAGFRDVYLYNVIQAIYNEELDLDSIYNMSTEESLKLLMSYKGIGNKVASCILLFAYQKFDVFPVDTWVKKMMKYTYNLDNINDIISFSKKMYGKNSSIALQYMFHYNRNKNDTN